MTMNYRDDHILVAASEFRPGDVDRLNQVLAGAALGRPLRDPGASSPAAAQGGLIPIPVDGADPLAIRDATAAHVQQGGGELPALIPDFTSVVGTTDEGTFFAAGKKSGHGWQIPTTSRSISCCWPSGGAGNIPMTTAWTMSGRPFRGSPPLPA